MCPVTLYPNILMNLCWQTISVVVMSCILILWTHISVETLMQWFLWLQLDIPLMPWSCQLLPTGTHGMTMERLVLRNIILSCQKLGCRFLGSHLFFFVRSNVKIIHYEMRWPLLLLWQLHVPVTRINTWYFLSFGWHVLLKHHLWDWILIYNQHMQKQWLKCYCC